MKKRLGVKIALLSAVLALMLLFFIFDLDRLVSFSGLKANLDGFREYYHGNRIATIAVFTAGYILMAALSLPGAAVASLAAGAVFGLVTGVILVSFAATLGATLAFLFSRYMFRDWILAEFSGKLDTINQGIEKEGGFYLFALRLVPVFPFFVINLVMGLTPISARLFYLVSLMGMLPGTVVYINAGTVLAQVDSPGGILSANMIFSFALLGIFPIAAKKIITTLRAGKVYTPYAKPQKFDYNLVVIGAGAAGLVASYIAAAVKAKVALVEADKMGGDCLNTGCVPSKALLASARMAARVRRAEEFGLDGCTPEVRFHRVMERVRRVIRNVEPHDSVDRYTALGVECIRGRAHIVSPFEVRVGDRRLTTRNIIVATGASPFVPDLPGLDTVSCLTSDTVWNLRTLPKRLVVMGAGPIGCELAQGFLRLGSRVTLVQRSGRIMKKEDPDAAQLVLDRFRAEGMDVRLNHTALEIKRNGDEKVLVAENGGGEKVEVPFDEILIALGRVPNIAGFGLEELGIETAGSGTIETNGFLQTRFPNLYCCGDVHGLFQFTHAGAHEAWYAAVNALFGRFRKFRADYSVIPWATFTEPEIARVGLNEQEARAKNIPYETVTYGIDDLDRAIADGERCGFVKVLTVPGKDRILGVTIAGYHSADIISEFVLAMKHGIGLNKVLGTIHIYPTMAEANKYAAGMWKKAHAPKTALALMAKFHAWMRN